MKIRPNRAKKPGAAPPPAMQEVAPPQVKRSKSKKWVIAVSLLFALVGWWVWDQFLRTSAYAIVEVDEIQVSAPLMGLIESMGVKEDGEYEAGTIAFTIVDRDTRDELGTLRLRLSLVESQMVEKSMNLKLSRADRLYERDELIAERRAELGKARLEQAKLDAEIAELSAELPLKEFDLTQSEALAEKRAISPRELVTARTEHEGASRRLGGLIAAQKAIVSRIEALRGAIDRPVPEAPAVEIGIEPLRREAALIRRGIEQLDKRLHQSQVRLLAPGKVVRVLHHPGEFVRASDPVLIVARPSTTRVVAYFDQGEASSLHLDQEVRIVSPYAPEFTGRTVRLGPSLRIGPEPIARLHPRGQPLFPVEIKVDSVAMRHLVPGSVVRVLPSGSFSTVKRAWAR